MTYNAQAWPGSQPRAADAGLMLVTSRTFTNAPAVNVGQCFTPLYDNYRIIWRVNNSSTGVDIRMRLRSGSVDDATASAYVSANFSQLLTGTGVSGETNTDTSWILRRANNSSSTQNTRTLELYCPALPILTFASWWGSDADSYNNHGTLKHQNATAYDGFTVFPTSGSITGVVRVYGYRQ